MNKIIVSGSNGERDMPSAPEPKRLTKRQRGMVAAGAGMVITFLLGTMVPREAPQPTPTPATTTTSTEWQPGVRTFNDYLAERVVKGRLLAHRKLTYFLGHVEISVGQQPPKAVVNPIILTDADVFYPGRSQKPGQTNSQNPGDFDFKVYAVPQVMKEEENWGDYGEGLDIYTDFLDDSTGFQTSFRFFDVDGQPVDMPDALLPQSESPFLQHVIYADDLALGSTHDANGTHYDIHAADGTRISFPAN
jgi:hypothetical protein